MYLLNRYDSTSGVGVATGMDPSTVASWAGYNIGAFLHSVASTSTLTNRRCADIHDLIQSSASVYQNHGLGASANMYDFVGFIQSYQSNPGTVFQQQVRGSRAIEMSVCTKRSPALC